MRAILSEKNLVIVLFVMVLIAFSFAHEDSKKMEKGLTGRVNTEQNFHNELTQNDHHVNGAVKDIIPSAESAQ
jgi:hypothetical protein